MSLSQIVLRLVQNFRLQVLTQMQAESRNFFDLLTSVSVQMLQQLGSVVNAMGTAGSDDYLLEVT